MKTLLSKSFFQVFLSTTLVLCLSGPIFFCIMDEFYNDDIDQVVYYRTKQFKEEQIPLLTHIEVESWNKYNPDTQILEFTPSVKLNVPMSEVFYNQRKNTKVNYRVMYTMVNIGNKIHLLKVRVPRIDRIDLVDTIIAQLGLLFLFMLVVLLLLHRIGANKLWSPFYKCLALLDSFSLVKNKMPNFPTTDTYEFNRLIVNLESLIQKSLDTFNTQKEFIENASHEMQTPIAVFQSQLDLLLQDPDLTAKQMEIISNLYKNTTRVSKLNKNLLLLAKIENNQFNEQEEVDVKDIISDFCTQFSELAIVQDIKLHSEVSSVRVLANRALLEVAISNLLSNAIRYNKKENGEIYLKLADGDFVVANTSDRGMLSDDMIFKRFSKNNPSQNGYGLGLAIVQQICEFNDWSITYEYIDKKHQFKIVFY